MKKILTEAVLRSKSERYFLNIILASTLTIIVTRNFLLLTGYFSLGTGNLHIAHVLYGGLFLFVGATMLLMSKGESIRVLSSYIIGIGWGLFIDEIGKFITRDNDYLFKPAFPIIYIILLLTCVLLWYLRRQKRISVKTRLANVTGKLESIIARGITESEKVSLTNELSQIRVELDDYCNGDKECLSGLTKTVSEYINNLETKLIVENKSKIAMLVSSIRERFYTVVNSPKFPSAFTTFVTLRFFSIILNTYFILLYLGGHFFASSSIESIFIISYDTTIYSETTSFLIMLGARLIVSSVLVAALLRYLKKRDRNSLIVAKLVLIFIIAVIDVFEFYFSQLSAVLTVIIDFAVLVVISEYIKPAEKQLSTNNNLSLLHFNPNLSEFILKTRNRLFVILNRNQYVSLFVSYVNVSVIASIIIIIASAIGHGDEV